MSNLKELYQETILEHAQNPRNFGKIKKADYKVQGFNPLCGDQYWVYIRTQKGRVKEISFEGKGCAISKASASLMTEVLTGKKIKEVGRIFRDFQKIVSPQKNKPKLGKLNVFSGISKFPLRVDCAFLLWQAVQSAIVKKYD